MCSVALYGDNLGEIMYVSLHFKQQKCNNFLIVYLKAFPQGSHFPCGIWVGISNGMNKLPDFGALSSQVHNSHLAKRGLINPLIDWLIAQNPSTLPPMTPVAGVASGIVGFVSTLPRAISFIPSFCYPSAEREA